MDVKPNHLSKGSTFTPNSFFYVIFFSVNELLNWNIDSFTYHKHKYNFEFRLTLNFVIFYKCGSWSFSELSNVSKEEIERYTGLMLRDLNDVIKTLDSLLSGSEYMQIHRR